MKRIAALSLAVFLSGSSQVLADQQKSVLDAAASKNRSAIRAPKKEAPCRWWQSGQCVELHQGGLPPEAPHSGTVITIDAVNNIVFLFQDGQLVAKGPAATGMEKALEKGRRSWYFHTPRGRMNVLRKIVNPIWNKPDWAYVEEGKPVPPPDSPDRKIRGKLGKFALDLGDGIMIHGTDDKASLGRNSSHGCIRVGDELLEKIFRSATVGTEVYVF